MKTKFLYELSLILFSFSLFYLPAASAQDLCKPVGWATENGGTTGGGNATPTVVSNYNDLKNAVTSASVKVVHISGVITFPSGGRISFQDQSGKTLYGLPGCRLVSNDLTKDGSGMFNVKRCSNIIIRNITFEGPAAYDTDGWDNMVLENCTNVWVDHCEFRDGMDGNLDVKNGSDFISITWCKFIYNKAPIPDGSGGSDDHRFSNLFGSSDGATGDRGKLRITLQNCWWAQGCKARMPRVRFGKVHVVNNYFNSTVSSSCVMAGFEADVLVESNVFENVKVPIDLMNNTFTAITSRNNIYTGTTGNTAGSGTAFTPPYALTVNPASLVKSMVTAGAGPTLTSPTSCGGTINTPPTVSVTSPANNASFTAPASITINANATDADGTVSNVQFFNGSTLLGSDATSPYSFAWANVAAGTYTLSARATDNEGATTTSSTVTVVVNSMVNTPPTVGITSPANNSSFTAPVSITINANAADANGTVSNVQFFNGSTLLGSDATSPYSFTWSTVAAGTHTLTAIATDNNGATTTSSPVTVVVNAPPSGVSIQAETACSVDGILNEHTNGGFNGTGYVNTNNAVGTSASWAINSSSGQVVSLNIRYANASANSRNMSLSVNGTVQVATVVFPSTGAWTTWNTASVQVNLSAGRNILQLKALMSEGGPNIDELTYGTSSVYAASCTITNQAPTVSLSAPTNNATFTAPASITIIANASDEDGTISNVQFYNGTTLLSSDATSSYSFAWTNVTAGTYLLTARATDNSGAISTSSSITVTVTESSTTCETSAIPSAADWIVRNDWADQNSGSGFINTSDAMQFIHRQWGRNFAWMIEAGKKINVEAGKPYTISFDFRDDALNKVISLEAGLASSYQWDGPVLVQPAVLMPSGTSSSTYTTKTVNFTASVNGEFYLVIRQQWAGQPSNQVTNFIKNVKVCQSTISARANSSSDKAMTAEVWPNPSVNAFTLTVDQDIKSLAVITMYGQVVYSSGPVSAEENVSFGEDFLSGFYLLTIQYEDGRTEIKKIQKDL